MTPPLRQWLFGLIYCNRQFHGCEILLTSTFHGRARDFCCVGWTQVSHRDRPIDQAINKVSNPTGQSVQSSSGLRTFYKELRTSTKKGGVLSSGPRTLTKIGCCALSSDFRTFRRLIFPGSRSSYTKNNRNT